MLVGGITFYGRDGQSPAVGLTIALCLPTVYNIRRQGRVYMSKLEKPGCVSARAENKEHRSALVLAAKGDGTMPQFQTVTEEADNYIWSQIVAHAGLEFKTARGLLSPIRK